MIRKIPIVLVVLLATQAAVADLDKSLLHEIATWKPGAQPPARLLNFPEGKLELPVCGMRVYGSAVEDYIGEVKSIDLLLAILSNSYVTDESALAAARQVIRLKGPDFLASQLSQLAASAALAPPLVLMRELLRSPFATLKVAKIDFSEMPQAQAEEALTVFRQQLESGVSWDEAYKAVSEAHLDSKASSYRTFVCYCFDGVVSPSGFDVLSYSIGHNLPAEHLAELFRSRPRTALLRTPTAAYLYFATAYSHGAV